ncbi:MAG: class I adenylate-forming enzyme family protein [Acidimicrobiia bacterium]
MTVGLATRRNRLRDPQGLAVFDGTRELTHTELDQRSNRIANLLLDRYGLEHGAKVALMAPNRLEVVEVLAGIAKAGDVYLGLNFRMGETELRSIFTTVGPRVIITAGEYREISELLGAEFNISVIDLDDSGPNGYAAQLQAASDTESPVLHRIDVEDDFYIVPTSGTTGLPKGVEFSHRASLTHGALTIIEYEISASTRYVIQIPHNSSVNITIVPCLMAGAAIGFLDSRGFVPEGFVHEVESRHVTHSFLVPTQLMRVLADPPDPKRLASLETLGYGSSPISPDRLGSLIELFGPKFIQLYGMAEIASIGTLLRKGDHLDALGAHPELLASAGSPSLLMDVRVVDDTVTDLGVRERGEVIFAGPYTMRAYYNDPQRTAETLIDGWVHSGDIGEWDDRGYLYIVDRKKNLIIRGGLNIIPTEIENVIYRHDGVLEVAVIGVPDEEWGEAILAVVAAKPGVQMDPNEILALCANSELTSIKRPERVEFVESLPKNAVGKIEKRTLRDMYWTGSRKV